MIKTNYTEMAGPKFSFLSEDQIEEIKSAAFDVMRTVGFKVLHKGAVKMLKQAGAVVKDDRVKIPAHLVLQAISTAPKGFQVFDRNGKRAMDIRGRNVYYGTSTASPTTMDARTGEVRATVNQDIANGALVADALPHIDFVMPFGSSQDVPGEACDIYDFPTVVNHTTKPIVIIPYSGRGCELVYEMAAEVVGGLDRLQERPFVLNYPEPIAPLVFPDHVIDRLFAAADLMMPNIPGSTVQFGATGPITLAGMVVQALAEGLMSITLAQLRKPGCPICLSCNSGVLDMATTRMAIGAPTGSLGLAVHAEVAQSFGLPTWGLAGATDSKMIDAQSGVEATFAILAQAMAGLNLIHDVGYLESGMACSCQQMVFGNEIISMVKHYMKGFAINKDTLATEVIEAVGPGGHFLSQRHTFENFREVLWTPGIMDRQTRQAWTESGSKPLGEVVQEKAIEILDTHKAPNIDQDVMQRLLNIRDKGEKELVTQ
jgi:trimethylamine--corrinoid protein Co-methyltransferase